MGIDRGRWRGQPESTFAATVLDEQGVPRAEIVALLSIFDLVVVRRSLELHLERLEEQLDLHRRVLQ